MKWMTSVCWALAMLLVVGCGGGDDAEQQVEDQDTTQDEPDTTQAEPDTTQAEPDTTQAEPDVAQDTTPPEPPPACPDPHAMTRAQEFVTLQNGTMRYVAITSDEEPYDVLVVEARGASAMTPGVYDLDGANLADCEVCVWMRTNCTGDGCASTLFVDEGEIEITATGELGEQFSAALREPIFKAITIDNDGVSTPIDGGQQRCLERYDFDQRIWDRHGQYCSLPNVSCVGEPIPAFSLQSCATGEMVNVQELLADKTAGWIIGTAGWCSACRDWMPRVLAAVEANDDPGLEMIYVLGENAAYGQPTVDYCRAYASSYDGADPANFYIDHDGQYSFSTLFRNVWYYPQEGGVFGLPWNAIIQGGAGGGEYIYADGASEQELLEALERVLNP